ncbi:MAG TPA: amidohydrolase family protein [Vicinamibacterales bacterium]|nr:amidohydrolase family protein [Vicinamibacterales bacterium]
MGERGKVSLPGKLSLPGRVSRRLKWSAAGAAIAALLVAGGALAQRPGTVPPDEQGECPPGTTEIRPGRCAAPGLPPPSILDYRPRSTLVIAEHKVPRAKFPVVDIHSHTGPTPETIDRLIAEMDALNVRVLVNLSGGGAAAVKQKVDYIRSSKHPDRFRVFANVNFQGAGSPGWAEKQVADLEQAVRNGAIGLKVYKNLGLRVRKADGTRLKVDDPALKPVWEAAARLDIPVLIHTGEPQEFFSPLDYHNERWLELALFPDRRHNMPGEPSFEELMKERDAMFAANPKTRFINAHFGWYGNDLARAAKLLDAAPNVVMDLSAVLYDFGRQPRAAREFFIKYQDRVLFGKDSYAPSEFPYYWRVLETADEYFDYYRDYHAFWKLYGMDLPDEVLRKVYHTNAQRVTKGLPR